MNVNDFEKCINNVMDGFDKKIIAKLIDSLSKMNKDAEIHKDKKGNIIYDKETKDTEIVKYEENIDDYMEREVLPYIPDAKAFFEENLTAKKRVIKIGAEIPFTRYFYKYLEPESSEVLKEEYEQLVIREFISSEPNNTLMFKPSHIGWVKNIPTDWSTIKGKYVFQNIKKIVGAQVD